MWEMWGRREAAAMFKLTHTAAYLLSHRVALSSSWAYRYFTQDEALEGHDSTHLRQV